MMNRELHRRTWMKGVAAACMGGSVLGLDRRAARAEVSVKLKSRYALNTSTLMGHKLPIDKELALLAKVGYDGVEPWVREIEAYADGGGSIDDLGKHVKDLGLAVPSAISFFEWIVDDDAKRKQALETARRHMEIVKRIGGTHIAAPATGATEQEGLDLRRAADRYRDLLKIGREIGVMPELEVWGFSKTLGNLADVAFVAIACGEPDATILPDVYHLYKGGSAERGLRMLNGRAIPAIHMNDYPADPPRATIDDSHRVFPGDGIAPLGDIVDDLRAIGFDGYYSLELFNRDYWKMDPEQVARTGLEKMKAAVEGSA